MTNDELAQRLLGIFTLYNEQRTPEIEAMVDRFCALDNKKLQEIIKEYDLAETQKAVARLQTELTAEQAKLDSQ